MRNKLALIAGLGLIFLTVPLAAHHSFEAEYDFNKSQTVTGTVTKVEWMNPHARFYVDVKEDGGKVPGWGVSSSPLVVKGRVIVYAGEKSAHPLRAYDTQTGALAWSASVLPGYSGCWWPSLG